jgi:Sulfotransferase domain
MRVGAQLWEWMKSGRPRRRDVVFLSYPKCGRTWHRVMLGYYLTRITNRPREDALKITELCRSAGGRIGDYDHNGTHLQGNIPFDSPELADPSAWTNQKVLLLVRDPRDILVSAYHHAHFRSQTFGADLSSFIRAPTHGIKKILAAWRRWNDNRHLASSFEISSYELLHHDPVGVLRQSVKLLNVRIDEALLSEATDFSRFENMKAYEEANLFRHGSMNLKDRSPQGAKVREGKAGTYHQHMSEEDLDFISESIERLGDPFRDYYQSPER